MQIQENYPLAELTTFRIGGPAKYYVKVTATDELKLALVFAREKSLGVLILGGGSNMLVSDRGFNGLVIHNKLSCLTIEKSGLITVSAGENWDEVVVKAVAKGLAGIECLSGVPGSAGGAVVQNIGAYGQTLSDAVVQVEAIEVATGNVKVFLPEACEFAYRNSWFKKNSSQYLVTAFQLKLKPNGVPTITYPHVRKHFEQKPSPSLLDVRQFIIKLRASKGYLIMEGFEYYATAGSFFTNPIVNQEQYERLRPMLGDPSLNRFWQTEKGIKLAAAFLLEEAGFGKGYREGTVGISPKHALSLINFDQATASEVVALADKIKNVVFDKYGVKLEQEVIYV